ncbi:SPOSA6832_05093, partial [Sporobolomyces salmonicolor]
MVSDLRGIKSASSSVPSTTASTRVVRRSLTTIPLTPTPTLSFAKREHISTTLLDESSTATASPTSSSGKSAKTSSSASTTPSSPSITATNVAASDASASSCSYIGTTSIPRQVGGALFSTLERIFCCLILIALFAAELPPPTTFVQRFWHYAFPPFGTDFGVGVLGSVQVFVGCTILSHSVSGFVVVAGWFLFVVGLLNLLFGLAFGARLKTIRAFMADACSPSDLRALKLKHVNSSNAVANSAAWYRFDREERGVPDVERRAEDAGRKVRFASLRKTGSRNGNGPKGTAIQISAPVMQEVGGSVPLPPPVYSGGRE